MLISHGLANAGRQIDVQWSLLALLRHILIANCLEVHLGPRKVRRAHVFDFLLEQLFLVQKVAIVLVQGSHHLGWRALIDLHGHVGRESLLFANCIERDVARAAAA